MLKVNGRGPHNPKIILLGEAPGLDEELAGKPFIGMSGKELDKMLREAGIDRDECYVTNVCIEENTPVLMADLTWKPLKDIQVGDVLLAFDEHGTTRGKQLRKWRYSTVTDKWVSEKECIKAHTASGDLVLTPDHVVLSCYQKRNTTAKWSKIENLRGKTSALALAIPFWEPDHSYEAGWLAGLFDGEGCLSVSSVPKAKRNITTSFAQNAGAVLKQGCEWLDAKGFEYSKSIAKCSRVSIRGGVVATLEFLGRIRPVRLLNKLSTILQDPPVFRPKAALLLEKSPMGLQRVVDLTTTTGTFIANGFAVHNCKYRPPSNELSAWMTNKKTIGPKNGWKQRGKFWVHPLITEGLEELQQEIETVNPQCIVGFGNLALWACTNEWGITNWRGSEMHERASEKPFVPTLHPASILRNWGARPLVIQDLKMRVVRRLNDGFIEPDFKFNTSPTCDEVCEYLYGLTGPIAGDIETSEGRIVCLGIAHSPTAAMCIPFIGPNGVWWTQEEYLRVKEAIRYASTSDKIEWVGQNWNYDAQYFQEDLAIHAMADFDTYIAQSVLHPGSERGLGFLSSIYCGWHSYWKEDGKDWSKGIKDFHKEFRYNCRDVCATWEVAQKQKIALEQAKLMPQFKERMKYSYSVYTMMRNGVNRDPARTEAIINEIEEAVQVRNILVAEKVGHPVNFASPKQVVTLFYKELGCAPIMKRGTGKVSTDDETLKKLLEKYPQYDDVVQAILESRSLSTIKSNFLMAELDPDGKMRSSWMATGTETFRLTSSKNAFHRGGPLQNVTDGKHTHSGRPLPNLRSTIVPTMGHTIFNCDLERADLQVVAWEADDAQLKDVLRKHGDIHLVNAVMVFDIKDVPYDECFPEHPRYEEHKEKYEQKRHFGKTFCHLTNYGGGGRTCAIKVHTTVHQADLLQKRWFEIHPGIKRWHQRTSAQLMGTRTIYNRFGYRRIYLDRLDGLLPEALAWLPQSTVAILVSLQQMAIEEALPDMVKMIMQGHDSLIGEYRTEHEGIVLPAMQKASLIAIPYDDPLYIPLELATSTSSWGEVRKREWPL